VKNGLNLVLGEATLHQRIVANIALDDGYLIDNAGANKLGLGHMITNQADDVGSLVDQLGGQPRP
jgi:hypothetical protein